MKKINISSCSPVKNDKLENAGDCRFYNDGNLTVFETPSPYLNDMMCEQNITCSDPTHSVQYEFEYFDTESGYDRLFVNELMFQARIHGPIRTELSSDLACIPVSRVLMYQ